MFNTQFALPLLLSVSATLGDPLKNALVPRQGAGCMIIADVVPGSGLTPCGWGGVISGCTCCLNQFACSDLLQTCGSLGCVDNPAYLPPTGSSSGCPAGMEACESTCMPIGAVCCPGGAIYCPTGYSCDVAQAKCFPSGSGATQAGTGVSTSQAAFSAANTGVGTGSQSLAKSTLATTTFGPVASQSAGGAVSLGGKVAAWNLLAFEAILVFFA